MSERIDALFSEHESPTVCSKTAILEQLSPIAAVTSSVQGQLASYRALVAQIEFSDHDPAIDAKLEHIHRTIVTVEAAAAAFAEKGRSLAKALAQLDAYLVQTKKDFARFDEQRAAKS